MVEKDFQKFTKEIKRHFDVVAEDIQSNIKLLAESVEGIQKQLIILRDMVAQNTEDIEIMRANMEVIKMDIQTIKQNLKRKVDTEEFETLEKRVLFLERKLS